MDVLIESINRSLIGEFWGHLNRLTPERPISDMSAIGIKSYKIFKIYI